MVLRLSLLFTYELINKAKANIKAVEKGVKFRTEMTIKCEVPVIGKLVTWIATKTVMHEKKIRAWMQHNIEESGESEHFIPKLYNHAQSK